MFLRDQLQTTLGPGYVVGRELGGGGMSRDFVAEEVRLARQVVVKVLAPELAGDINADRFEREIRVVASLQQANIVPLRRAEPLDLLARARHYVGEGHSTESMTSSSRWSCRRSRSIGRWGRRRSERSTSSTKGGMTCRGPS